VIAPSGYRFLSPLSAPGNSSKRFKTGLRGMKSATADPRPTISFFRAGAARLLREPHASSDSRSSCSLISHTASAIAACRSRRTRPIKGRQWDRGRSRGSGFL
jgi:hypothetical protein